MYFCYTGQPSALISRLFVGTAAYLHKVMMTSAGGLRQVWSTINRTRLETDKTEMRKIRNLVNISVKNARADFIKDKLETHKNDPNKFWKHISEIIHNKKANSQQLNNIHDDTNDIIDQDNLAHHINHYFSDIGPNWINISPGIKPLKIWNSYNIILTIVFLPL